MRCAQDYPYAPLLLLASGDRCCWMFRFVSNVALTGRFAELMKVPLRTSEAWLVRLGVVWCFLFTSSESWRVVERGNGFAAGRGQMRVWDIPPAGGSKRRYQ